MSFDEFAEKNDMDDDDDPIVDKRNLEPQSVDPKKGWNFRGVHKVPLLYQKNARFEPYMQQG